MNRTKRTSARVSSFFVFLRRGCGSGGTRGCRPTGDNRWVQRGRGVGDAAPYAGSGDAVRGYYGLPHQCAHWFAMTFFGGAVRAGRCGHRPLRKACRAGPMCPAVEGAAGVGGSSGKSAKRRRWRKKRAGFEEVPRLAATTVDGNRLARRRAIADPYA